MAQSQQQWQGPERRQSLGPYAGEDRRRKIDPGAVPQRTQERKDDQEERARQQRDQTDIH